jgi:ABC-type polysaccharide/polyol phosphate export permease
MISYFGRIWACRYFWLSLVRIDLRARYRRSVLGVGWSLLRPVLLTIILCVVFRRLFKRPDVWDFAPYLLSGLCLWDYLTIATKQGCQCFFAGEHYIRQHPTPLAVFPLRVALAETFHFVMGLVVLFGLVWFAKGFANLPALLSLIPTFFLLFALVWAIGLLAGFANVYFQDTQHLCDVGFQLLFYATPIVYYPNDLGNGRLHWLIMNCNPVVPLMQLFREPILEGRVPALSTYAQGLAVVLAVSAFAALVCYRAQRRLVFHL